MSFDINGVGANYYSQLNAMAEQAQNPVAEQTKADEAQKAKEDGFVKSPFAKPKAEEISALKADMKTNVGAFRAMVQGLFQKQGGYKMDSMQSLTELTESAETPETAFEDGPWGIEAVATKILDFAKSLAGGDESKLELLEDAVMKGFKQAEEIWGGKLPDVSYKTLDRVKQGFQEWKDSFKKTAAVTGEDA